MLASFPPVRDFKRILSYVSFVVEYPFCVLFNDPSMLYCDEP